MVSPFITYLLQSVSSCTSLLLSYTTTGEQKSWDLLSPGSFNTNAWLNDGVPGSYMDLFLILEPPARGFNLLIASVSSMPC